MNKTDRFKVRSEGVHSISIWFIVGVITLLLGGFIIINSIDSYFLPTPLKISDEVKRPREFIAERAQNHLHQLTSLGPRVVGSYENEVLAVNLLKREISIIIQQAHRSQNIELDTQVSSGSYYLEFYPYGFLNVYSNIQNVIIKLHANNETAESILINCHYDSVPTSPGGSDDGISCVTMLEVLRLFSQNTVRPRHHIIFLFNGAEEVPLQAAHGFITQHRWAPSVSCVINIEAAGSGGREIVFQADSSYINVYASAVPHPFGQSTGQDLFERNLIPSDTDFRVFRDFGRISGLDMAFSRNGYVYHTEYDTAERIPGGSFQHVGENLLALVTALSSLPEIPKPLKKAIIYFDLFGLKMFVYEESTAWYINISTAVLSVLLATKAGKSHFLRISLYCGAVIIGAIVSLVFAILVGLFLDYTGNAMSWYAKPELLVGLYGIPTFALSSFFPILLSRWSTGIRGTLPTLGTRAQVLAHAVRLFWTLFLILSSFVAIRSSYIFLIPISFANMAFLLIYLSKLEHTARSWVYIYLVSNTIPLLFGIYQALTVVTLFVPITGRIGSDKNPELICGILSVLVCLYVVNTLIPVVSLLQKPQQFFLGLLALFVITIVIVMTPLGFPYSGNIAAPAPQRFWITHTRRVFHNENGTVTSQDSGYFLLNMDRNSPTLVKDYVSEIKNVPPLNCSVEIFCGLPLYISRMVLIHKESTWIPALPPIISQQTDLKLISKLNLSSNVTRFTFNYTGPSRVGIYISPRPDHEVVDWSFNTPIPKSDLVEWEGRPVYFILSGYGMEPQHPRQWYIDVLKEKEGPSLKVVASGIFMHHSKERTAHYNQFLQKFPKWTHVVAWIADYNSYVF